MLMVSPQHMYKWRTGRWDAVLRLTIQANSATPPPKHKDPCEVHNHDRNITGKDTNPFSEGRETQLYYVRGKTVVPGEKTVTRAQWCESQTPFGIISRSGGTAIAQPTELNDFKSCQSEVGTIFRRKMITGCPSWTPEQAVIY